MIDYEALKSLIQKALKAKKVTYSGLAKKLNISESGVKKLFSGTDMSFKRFSTICEMLDVRPSVLMQHAENGQPPPFRLTPAQEAFFLKNPDYYRFFRELVDFDCEPDRVRQAHKLDEYSADRYLAKLERLGLVTKKEGRWVVKDENKTFGTILSKEFGPVIMGDVHRRFLEHAQRRFSKAGAIKEQNMYYGVMHLTKDQLKKFNEESAELLKKTAARAQQQRPFIKQQELMEVGALCVSAPLDSVRMLHVPNLPRAEMRGISKSPELTPH